MATNWSKLAKQFLDKMKPAEKSDSDSTGNTQPTTSGSTASSSSVPSGASSAPSGAAAASPPSPQESSPSAPARTGTIDIGRQQVGGVYAKALLGAAGKNADSLLAELGGLSKLLGELPAFREILDSPRVSSEEKVGILDRSLKGRVSPTLLNFLKVVSEHERLDCLQYIYQEARSQHYKEQGVAQVIITTAETLDSGELKRVKSDLEKKLGGKVDIQATVDPRIIGGIVVRIGDQVYDGSVSQRLSSLRESAVQKAVEKMRASTDSFATSS